MANTERHLDNSKAHNARAADNANELKQLNRSIFRPVITFNKDSKRAAKESAIQQRYDDERDEREKAMMDIRETQNRVGRATGYGGDDDGSGFASGPRGARTQAQMDQRKRFQFDKTESDDELEDEIDGNLDEIAAATKRLKALGLAMGQELDSQNGRLDTMNTKVDKLDNSLHITTNRVSLCRQNSAYRTLTSADRHIYYFCSSIAMVESDRLAYTLLMWVDSTSLGTLSPVLLPSYWMQIQHCSMHP